jgi:hypothetical protein
MRTESRAARTRQRIADVSLTSADTGRRELEFTRQKRPGQLRIGRHFQDAQRLAKVDTDGMQIALSSPTFCYGGAVSQLHRFCIAF